MRGTKEGDNLGGLGTHLPGLVARLELLKAQDPGVSVLEAWRVLPKEDFSLSMTAIKEAGFDADKLLRQLQGHDKPLGDRTM